MTQMPCCFSLMIWLVKHSGGPGDLLFAQYTKNIENWNLIEKFEEGNNVRGRDEAEISRFAAENTNFNRV